jgi:pimeloyl-ACP methyl ester carboxylesterase
MKKICLLAALLLISTLSFSQNVISLFGKANEFFNLLESEKYDTAHKFFEVSEQTKITPENLKQLWTSIKEKLGKVEYLDAVQSKTEGEFFAVTLEGKFERDKQSFTLLFNKSEKIVGLYLPPNAIVYTKPFYADTALYTEKSVYLKSGTHTLAAIITIPKNKVNFPMVVLVHGSGPSDMDETIGANKPFRDLAMGLASKGIASFRYVKRTTLYAHEFLKAFTVKEEVTDDALAAIAMAKTVKGVNLQRIFVLGHSLGGMLAPKLATLAPELRGIILAAAPARKLTDLIIDQNKYYVSQIKDTTGLLDKKLQATLVDIEKSRIFSLGAMKADSVILGLPASYWIDLNNYDQVATAKKLITQRIFIIQGGKDFQVSELDYNLWGAALSKKPNVKLKFYPEINHLLSPQLEKGTAQQYQTLVNVSESVVKDIADWIKLP